MSSSNTFVQLMSRLRAGDDSAMSQLMNSYGDAFERIARQLVGRMLQSQLDAVDLVQSVQIVLWLGLRTGKFVVESPDAMLGLVRTLLRRKVARYMRSHRPQMTETIEASLVETVVDRALIPISTEPNPQKSSEFDDLVEYFLGQLGELDRQLVRLRLRGHSTADVARDLNLDPGYLRVRLGRLRRRFAQFREMIDKMPAEKVTAKPQSVASEKVS
jgi:RNA polymerase sigma factor (sigma-70 family)